MLTSLTHQEELLWNVIAGFDVNQTERVAIAIPKAIYKRLQEFSELHELEAEEVVIAMMNRYFGEQPSQ